MTDELAKAITRIIYPALKPEGFRRHRKRDLIRAENGIVQRLHFQVSGWGGRDFCATACANLVAGNEHPTLAPGIQLTPDESRGRRWLPSKTAEEADRSARIFLRAIEVEALPWFEKIRTVSGLSALLDGERWSSTCHLSFQRGVTAAWGGDASTARRHLVDAVQLYEALHETEGWDWCVLYLDRAEALLQALSAGAASELLAAWYEANSRQHGIR